MDNSLWTDTIPNWLSAIGTVGAVIVALFQKTISMWFNRPKIEVSCKNATPFIEELDVNSDSSTKEKELRIRVKVENKGNNTADHCVVNVDCYYEKRAGEEKFCKTEFAPVQIRDYRNSTPAYIAPHLVYYLDIAAIRKSDEMTSSDDGSKHHQFYKLFLLGDKSPQKLGTGTFIIPIKVGSPRIETHVGYLKIYWDGVDFTIEKKHFGIEMLTKDMFNSLKKE